MGETRGKEKVFDLGGIGCHDLRIRSSLFYRLTFAKKLHLSVRYRAVDSSAELTWEKEFIKAIQEKLLCL